MSHRSFNLEPKHTLNSLNLTLCVCAFQCSLVFLPVGGGVERGREVRLSAVRAGKHIIGYPRPTGAGSDVTTGNEQKVAGAW